MFQTLRRMVRKTGHITWIQMQESGAIMSGTPIQMDPRETGDKYQPSPFVREDLVREDYEIRETRTVHKRGVAK